MFTKLSDIKLVFAITTATLFIIGAGILYWRGARYALVDALWRLFRLKGYSDSSLQQHHENLLDAERFKVMHRNADLETLNQAKAAAAWAEQIQLSTRTLAQAKQWVKWDTREVQTPNAGMTVLIAVFCFASYTTVLWSIALVSHNDMLARFKDSKTLVWIDENQAKQASPWSPSKWTLTSAACDTKPHHGSFSLKPEEIETLCESFSTENLRADIDENVYLQRIVFGMLGALGLMMMCWFFANLKARIEATSIRRRLAKRTTRRRRNTTA